MINRTVISTRNAAAVIGPYSQAIKTQDLIFLAGQTPLDPNTQNLVVGDVAAQTEQVIRNIEAILTAAGSGLDRVVRCVVYLTSMDHFGAMNGVYERFFDKDPPARTTIAVSALPRNSLVEIEATALSGAGEGAERRI